MNKQRLGILIIAAIGMLATFLPWFKAPIIGTIYGTEEEGWITFILFTIPLIISLLNDKSKPLKEARLTGAIVPSIIAALIGIWKIKHINSNIGDDFFSKALSSSFSIEFGLYLIVLAGIALPIIAFLIKDKS